MNIATRTLAVALVAGGALFVAAQPALAQGRGGGRGGGGPEASPAATYRINIMRGFQTYQGMLRSLGGGDAGAAEHAVPLAQGWALLASTLEGAFPAGSAGEGSRATAAIWEQPDEFAAKIADLKAALDGLVAAAQSGDMAAISTAAGAVNPTCGGCHNAGFRARPAGRGGVGS